MGRKAKSKAKAGYPAAAEAKETAPADRDSVEQFLKKCITLLKSEATRDKLKDTSSGRPGMTMVNELQESVWDELGVSKAHGRHAVEAMEQLFPADAAALLSLRAEFAQTSDQVYWQSLEDRRPSVLESKKDMPRMILLDFYTGCCCKFGTADVKQRFRTYVAANGDYPAPIIDEVLGEVLELLGFERDHGRSCCKKILETKSFPKDPELVQGHSQWTARIEHDSLMYLREHQKSGGELKCGEVVIAKLLEKQAKEELDTMSPEERGQCLEIGVKKLKILSGLPQEGRTRYLEKLGHEEKVELAKAEILYANVMQQRQQQSVDAQVAQCANVD